MLTKEIDGGMDLLVFLQIEGQNFVFSKFRDPSVNILQIQGLN